MRSSAIRIGIAPSQCSRLTHSGDRKRLLLGADGELRVSENSPRLRCPAVLINGIAARVGI